MATTGAAMRGIMIERYRYQGFLDELRAGIVPLVVEYIREACPDMVPSDKNGHAFFDCAGTPSTAAIEIKTNTVVGFTLLTPINYIETNYRMIHSIGTYVLPEHRRQGIAETLRRIAMRKAKNEGFQQIQGFTYADDKSRSIVKLGGSVVGVVMITPLEV